MAGQGKKVFCDVCGVTLPSASLLPTHNKGKKHQRLLGLKEEREASTKRSIYVRGFQNSGSIEEELTSYFDHYGKVSNIFLDKEKGVFAIVEFATEEDVFTVLAEESLPPLSGRKLIVKERSVRKESHIRQVECKKSKKSLTLKHGGQWTNQQMAAFLSEELINNLKSSLTVQEQVKLLMKDLCLTEDDLKLRRLVCQLLQEVFQEVYPQATVMPFGSTVSGVGWKGSDLDVCLLTSELSTPFQGQEVVDYSLIIDVLRSFAPGCVHVIPILTAKCPLVKFTHQPTGLSCDLSVNNRLGIANSDLLQCYMSLDTRVPQLVFIVRAWAKAKGITAGRQLSNYALTLMVLYFMQTRSPPVIPTLQQCMDSWIKEQTSTCQGNNNPETGARMVDNWDCSFFSDVARLSPSQNTKNLGQLLEEYFAFYTSKFDFENCVVSIRRGCKTTITSVLEELKVAGCAEIPASKPLPVKHEPQPICVENPPSRDGLMAQAEMPFSEERTESQTTSPGEASIEQDKTGSKRAEFKVSPMCVQDPFELAHNLTQNVPLTVLKHILVLMKDAEKICKDLNAQSEIPNENATTLLELLTVPKTSKKRKNVDCHSFFVEYQDVTDTSCNVDLSSAKGVFLFVVESFQKEFGMSCEMRSVAKKTCINREDSASHGMSCTNETPKVCDAGNPSCHSGELRDEVKVLDNFELIEDNLKAICTAFDNTWTHCRKERRRSLQKTEKTMNKFPLPLDLDVDKETTTEAKALNLSHKHNGRDSENVGNSSSPILIFELKVNSSTQENTVQGCKVSMEHVDSKEFQLFGNFFSVYKKYFTGCLSK